MSYKRKLPLLISLFLLFALLHTPVSAHSGKTDSNGGHTDHDTGEYHYHHGYPAHSHSDIDGDGIPDCPYAFDDKTGHGNTGSSSGSEPGGSISSGMQSEPTSNSNSGISSEANTQHQKSTDIDLYDIVFSVEYFCVALFAAALLFLSWYLENKRVSILDDYRWLRIVVRGAECISGLILAPYGIALMFLGAAIAFAAWIFYGLWMLISRFVSRITESKN